MFVIIIMNWYHDDLFQSSNLEEKCEDRKEFCSFSLYSLARFWSRSVAMCWLIQAKFAYSFLFRTICSNMFNMQTCFHIGNSCVAFIFSKIFGKLPIPDIGLCVSLSVLVKPVFAFSNAKLCLNVMKLQNFQEQLQMQSMIKLKS